MKRNDPKDVVLYDNLEELTNTLELILNNRNTLTFEYEDQLIKLEFEAIKTMNLIKKLNP